MKVFCMQDNVVEPSFSKRDPSVSTPEVGRFSRMEAEEKCGHKLEKYESNLRQMYFDSEDYYPLAIGAILPCDDLASLLPAHICRAEKALLFFLPNFFETSLSAMAAATDENLRMVWDLEKRSCKLHHAWSASSRNSVVPLEFWVNDGIFDSAFSHITTEESEPKFLPIVFVTKSTVTTGGLWIDYEKLCDVQASSSTAINARRLCCFTESEIEEAQKTADLYGQKPWMRGLWRYDFAEVKALELKRIDAVYVHVFDLEPNSYQ